jgi:hypothetical protein
MEDKNHIVWKNLEELRQRQKTIGIQIDEDVVGKQEQEHKRILNVPAILSRNLTKKLDQLTKIAKNTSSSLSSLAHKETLRRNSQDELRKKNKWIDVWKLLELEKSLLEKIPKVIESIPSPPPPPPPSSSSSSPSHLLVSVSPITTSNSVSINSTTTTTTSSSDQLCLATTTTMMTTMTSNPVPCIDVDEKGISYVGSEDIETFTTEFDNISKPKPTTTPPLSATATTNSVPQIENLNFIRDSLIVLMLTMLPTLRAQNFDLVVLFMTSPPLVSQQQQQQQKTASPHTLQSNGSNNYLLLPSEEDYKKNAIIFVKKQCSISTSASATTTSISDLGKAGKVDVYLQYATYKTAG